MKFVPVLLTFLLNIPNQSFMNDFKAIMFYWGGGASINSLSSTHTSHKNNKRQNWQNIPLYFLNMTKFLALYVNNIFSNTFSLKARNATLLLRLSVTVEIPQRYYTKI